VPNLQLMRRRDALPGFLSRDIIDQEIQQLCEKWPAILEDNTIIRKAQGRYRINGREVTVSLRMREATREEEECVSKTPSLDEAKAADGQVMDLSGDLIVRDGPLKQPFLDYVFDTGQKEYYSMAEPDKLENKSVDTPKPLAPDLKGGQLAVQDDRLEAMEIAWTSSDADSLSELPQMPLPPPLPKSSEPVQHAAGIHLTKTCQETSQLCRTYDAEACLVEIVMDMPIAPAGSFPVCHAMFCTPQACAVASPNSPVVMGPHGDSSTKPCVELQETDVPGGPVKPSELVMRNPWPQDGAVQLLPLLPAVSDFRGNGPAKVKRRHKYGEVILPGELTFGFGHAASKIDQAQAWPDRPLREAPTKQAPAALALDELHLAEL